MVFCIIVYMDCTYIIIGLGSRSRMQWGPCHARKELRGAGGIGAHDGPTKSSARLHPSGLALLCHSSNSSRSARAWASRPETPSPSPRRPFAAAGEAPEVKRLST